MTLDRKEFEAIVDDALIDIKLLLLEHWDVHHNG